MTKTLEADFYAVEDSVEFLTADTITEAMTDWYEGLYQSEIDNLPETVVVDGYVKEVISDNQVGQWLESLLEGLDENYGCEETWGDYALSERSQELWKAFTAQVRSEYPVSQLKLVGSIVVNVGDHL
jgi:hypothetical protein